MRAGRLRHRIIIQRNIPTQSVQGEWAESWSTFITVWGSIEPLRGKEFLEAAQSNSQVQGKVVIRYREGILPSMRIKYGSRILRILSIVHLQERRRELDLMYKEDLDA